MCSCTCGNRGAVVSPPEPPFTAEQVEKALYAGKLPFTGYNGNKGVREFRDGDGGVDWQELFYADSNTAIETPLGAVTVVEAVGGEGEGDHAHLVVHVIISGQYFRKDGWYQSYDGLYLDGEFREVQKISKTIEVYE